VAQPLWRGLHHMTWMWDVDERAVWKSGWKWLEKVVANVRPAAI
jgi:hypothetical protein